MQAVGQFVQFAVHPDAQSLERAGRGMDALALGGAAGQVPDQARQFARARERALGPGLDDRLGDPARVALLAEDGNQPGKVPLFIGIDHLGGGFPIGARAFHAHVEGTVEAEREAPVGIVDLHRGHAEIEGDAVDRRDAVALEQRDHLGKPALDQREAALVARGNGTARLDRIGIPVDGKHRAVGGVED